LLDKVFKEEEVTINTVDSFQGQEADVVIISLVRSNDENEIGFLKDYRRMNVALTRARKKLIVIGDSATIGGDSFYQEMLQFFEVQESYESAWIYMG
jgi:superfamily I DNA and/or RNA helicase